MSIKSKSVILAGILLATGGVFASAGMEDVNSRVEAGYWSLDGNHGFITKGNITTPTIDGYGAQFDLGYGDVEGAKYFGLGGHLFWRHSQELLYGVAVSYQQLDTSDGDPSFYRIGAEAERYYKGIQINWGLGLQTGDVDGIYATTGCRWFYNDNLMLSAGAELTRGLWGLNAAIEYQPEFIKFPGLSFYAETSLAKDSFQTYGLGIKYYFGKESSTISRAQRSKMLPNLLPSGINTLQKWNPPQPPLPL